MALFVVPTLRMYMMRIFRATPKCDKRLHLLRGSCFATSAGSCCLSVEKRKQDSEGEFRPLLKLTIMQNIGSNVYVQVMQKVCTLCISNGITICIRFSNEQSSVLSVWRLPRVAKRIRVC
jgi:hypothetical protein